MRRGWVKRVAGGAGCYAVLGVLTVTALLPTLWVMISSFNEWLEGRQIEPATSYGTLFLEMTRTLGDTFRRTAAVSSPAE